MYDGFRIRNMSMRGVYSQGIVFDLDILPKDFTDRTEGVVVADVLNIVRYDPADFREKKVMQTSGRKIPKWKKFLMRFKFFRNRFDKRHFRGYPEKIVKSDETNIQKIFDSLKDFPAFEYYLTEKLEGQAATYALVNGKFAMYSHNFRRELGDGSNYDYIAKKYRFPEVLKAYRRETGSCIAVQGEIIGPGIQNNIYNLSDKQFYIHKVTDLSRDRVLGYDEIPPFISLINNIADNIGLHESVSFEWVPFVEPFVTKLFDSVKEIINHSECAPSVFGSGVLREGVVWRCTTSQSIGFKAKSPKYDLWFNKKEKTE
jgi:hypothetical protein